MNTHALVMAALLGHPAALAAAPLVNTFGTQAAASVPAQDTPPALENSTRAQALSGAQASRAAQLTAEATPAPVPTMAPYRVLDNIEGPHIDLGLAPVRPMVVTADEQHLYAVNTHASTVAHYDRSLTLQGTFVVPWGPVSIALWDPTDGPAQLLVVSRGTHALSRLDRATGRILDVLPLPSEPADLLVDAQAGRAYVACSGADAVVSVDLASFTVEREVPIPSKHPVFLSFDGDQVLVAPQLSGNNSTVDDGHLLLDAGGLGVVDLNEAALGLPDEDLFRIDFDTGAVHAVSRGAGAILFDHGLNPATGAHWQLLTEAFNTGPFGEPALRGDFVANRIAITALPAPGADAAEDHTFIELDTSGFGGPSPLPELAEAVGQPYALAFSGNGDAFVSGLLTDNVTWLSPQGELVAQLQTCSLPRGLAVLDGAHGAPSILLVYCWGSNTIEGFSVEGDVPFVGFTLDVGYDPSPPLVREGRALFFSAQHSEGRNASCASCHVEGATDMLAWDLGDLPFDDKGPLITQTLKGIEPVRPYHWRGERADLIDFNGAFEGLLGAHSLDGAQFSALQTYIFGLQNAANPRQDEARRVNGALTFVGASTDVTPDAVRGQDLFFDKAVVGAASCNTCHSLPLGTNSDIFNDEGGHTLEPQRSHFKVAPFQAIWRKEQPTLETIDYGEGPRQVPTLGVALSAAGLSNRLFDFVSLPPFGLNAQDIADITAFVHQHDSGLAPAVHRAVHLSPSTVAARGGIFLDELVPQAQARSCDLVAVGWITQGELIGPLSYVYDRGDGRFHPDLAKGASLSPDDMVRLIGDGLGELTAVALPVGMGLGFVSDVDGDGLLRGDELALGTDPLNSDSDGDGHLDGHEAANGGDPSDPAMGPTDTTAPELSGVRLVYATSQVAKIAFDTDELATWQLVYTADDGTQGRLNSSAVGTQHTALLRTLRPGTSYEVALTAVDLGGNTTQATLPGGLSTEALLTPGDLVVGALELSDVQRSGGALSATLSARADLKGGGQAAGFSLAADVYVNGAHVTLLGLSSQTGPDGWSHLPVSLQGLSEGDEVRLVVFSLYRLAEDGAVITTGWSLPDTQPELRSFKLTY